MISWLRGRPVRRGLDYVILDVNGVGYLVQLHARTLQSLGSAEVVELWVHSHIREDLQALFGWASWEELQFFKLMVSVDGIGPKLAMAIVGSAQLDVLKQAVLTEDRAFLARAPGVGNKTAARLILELKPKIETDLPMVTLPAATVADSQAAVNALVALGYGARDAQMVVGGMQWDPQWSVEQAVAAALRELGKR